MLEHVTSEFAFAIKGDVTDLTDMRLLLWTSRVLAGSRLREFVLAPFPKIQRSVIQIVKIVRIIDDDFIFLPGFNAILFLLDASVRLFRFFIFFRFRNDFGTIFLGGRWFFHHKHAQ